MAQIFLDEDETFPIGASADVFGRAGGMEAVQIRDGVAGVNLDANIERIELPQSSTEVAFAVTDAGLALRAGGRPVATLPSLNQDMAVRFSDGDVTLRQIGATQFEIEGANGDTQTVDRQGSSSVAVDVRDGNPDRGDDDPSGGRGGDSGDPNDGADDGGDTTLSGDVLVDDSPATSIPARATSVTVGNDNTGSLTLTDGQSRTFTQSDSENVVIAASSNSDGALTLRNAGTDIVTAGTDNAVHVGREGSGDLTVENGAEISTLQFEIGREGDGSATIRGSDSKVTASNDNGLFSGEFNFTSGFVRVSSKPNSSGNLEILDGGELEIRPGDGQNSETSGPGINIGEELGSNGDVTVDGQGSEIDIRQDSPFQNLGPYLSVGDALGQGDLTVSNNGQINLDGPSTTFTVSEADSSEASETSDNSAVEESTVTIESGGQVNVTADQTANVRFAPLTGGEATVNVLGQGSVFSATGSTSGYGGSVGVGQAGSADVTVSDGGKFETLYMTAGGDSVPENASPENYNIGGTGNFDVDGSGSELLMQGSGTAGYGSFLNIGRRGTGSLDVTNGGSVSISSEQGTFPGFVVGRSADGDGSAVVDGPNSDITVSGDQGTAGDGGYAGYIGIGKEGGTGTLTVRNGGSVMNDSAGLTQVGGSFPSAASDQTDGSITVTGSGSSFDAGDQLIIGGGFDFGSGQPIFDQPGTGSVTVENGATLTAGDGEGDGETDIFVGNNGSLQVASGASLTGDVQTDAGGVFAMGASPGLAMVQGNADIGGATTFELDGTGDGDFDRLEAGGAVTLGGDVTVDVGRGFTPEAGDSFAIVEADGGASLASDLAVSTSGLPDDLAIDLTANGGSIVATVMDSGSDPDALA